MTLRPKFSRYNFPGYLTWLVVSIIGGYAIYQGSIIVLMAQLRGGHGLTAAILGRIFVRDVVWAWALSAIHCSIVWLVMQTIPSYSPPFFPLTSQSGDRPPGCGRKG